MTARPKDAPGALWSRPQPARREQPPLSRRQIVAEALAILDGNGIEALSMRKLGARLNAGATSMYTHVANKDELLALVVDEVFAELPLPATGDAQRPDAWREAVAECAEGVRSVILRHPWMVSVIGDVGMVYLGPSWMRLSEAVLTILEESGFGLAEANDAMGAVLGYTIGTASVEASWLRALARHGREEQEWMDQLLPAVIDATKDYPRLHRLYTTQVRQEISDGRDSEFTGGIRLILDGIEAGRRTRQET
ncbi:AcrR family transcriptional regulator [Kitasatospora sp. MAA19]|uniref:TetR/AcrR family transcriptional regulator n=1 Tax=unclassified Kitasatospora TaxID=2633591 RepID=UPI0024732C5E|nr:TetR/AcrR family transcriptional regulator C-terminal domain-containing protein [Kitasatospora sp. MAA19]MDH6703463.1 AcrR family transcriptional regulator [Kitasatospora sp. MAA19]